MLGILDLGEDVAFELLQDLAVDAEALRSHLIAAVDVGFAVLAKLIWFVPYQSTPTPKKQQFLIV